MFQAPENCCEHNGKSNMRPLSSEILSQDKYTNEMVTQINVRLQLLFMSRGEAEGPLRTMAALVPDECQLPSPFPCSLAKNTITKITTGGFFLLREVRAGFLKDVKPQLNLNCFVVKKGKREERVFLAEGTAYAKAT